VRTLGTGDVVGEIAVFASAPDRFAHPEVAEGGLRTASVVATSPMRLITVFKRDICALEERAPVVTERLRALLDERRAHDAERELATRRTADEQGGSGPPGGARKRPRAGPEVTPALAARSGGVGGRQARLPPPAA
jgi:CRP-like cAMP-binding protein